MLDYIRQDAKKETQSVIIWLHGLGADGNDFCDMSSFMNLPNTRFIFPHAPHRPITINNGFEMRGWYDIHGFSLESREDRAGIMESASVLSSLIERTCVDVPFNRIILGGFSQGAAMALFMGLSSPQRFGGVVALSGYLPLARELPAAAVQANKGTPIFLAHGTQDSVVPFHFGERTRDFLLAQGCQPQWKTYPIEHQVSAVEMADIRSFLRGLVD